ncbi:MAG: gliding motility-associated C-terminal domain-containing protein, partial [Saprospiraceae bacterium]|nr:gliding motility-associated C-terminal domain-containing protein [Saprospiraceae bacterium]
VLATNAYGCTVAAALLVVEDRLPPLAEAGAELVQVSCQQTTLTLDAAPGSSVGPAFVGQWFRQSAGGPVLVATGTALTISASGLYIFSNLDTRNGCVAADSVLVDWTAPIAALASIDSISCFGENDGAIQLQHLSGGAPPFTYSIDQQNFGPDHIFENLGPGLYPVLVRDAGGCLWQASVSLNQPPQLAVSLLASDTLIDLGHVVLLQAKPLPAGVLLADIQWQPLGGGMLPGELRQRVQPEATTQYIVQVTDLRGCTATDRVTVAVVNYQVYAPNAISPGSAQNGVFTLFAAEGIPTVRLLRVYDRWGNLVFENKNFAPGDPAAGWDGSFRQQVLAPGVFVWYAELEGQDGRLIRLSGDVTVVD